MLKKFLLSNILIIFLSSFIFAGVSINPTRQEVVLNGLDKKKASVEFVVENVGLLDETVFITTKDWQNSPNNMEISVSSWLVVDVSSFVVKPYESKVVKCDIDLPGAVGAGYVSAYVSFTTNENSINNVVSIPVYVIKYATENKEYTPFYVVNFNYNDADNRFVMMCDIVNNSNFYFRPKIKYTLKKGKDIIFEDENLNTSPVYAMSRRNFSSSYFEGTLKKGKYVMTVEVDVNGEVKTKEVKFKVNTKK